MEIIEIGAVMVESDGFKVVGEYSRFIRPVRNPTLTQFCTELTSITQELVDGGLSYSQAIAEFESWLHKYGSFAFCSWGDFDKSQLENDCQYHSVPMPIGAEHFNIKKLFSQKQGLKKKLGMSQALQYIGLALEGRHHRGIDDARNMARLIPYIAC